MIFKSPEELLEFMNNLDLENSTLVFKTEAPAQEIVKEDEKDCACKGQGPCQCATTVTEADESLFVNAIPENSEQIIVETFAGSPSVKLRISESGENTFYVKDYEGVPDACGTGRVELPNRVAHMNMCEMDGVATISLDLMVEGVKLSGVSVNLAKTDDTPYLVLNKKHFKS